MALLYNTEEFAEIVKDLDAQVAAGALPPEQMAAYIKQKYRIGKDDWNNAIDKAEAAEKKYFEMKELYKNHPLASADRYIPAHLREQEESTLQSILNFPSGMMAAGIRSSAQGFGQLVGMTLSDQTRNQILDEMASVDDYLSENKWTSFVYDRLKEGVGAPTTNLEEIAGLIASLGVGTGVATKIISKAPLLGKLPGWVKRTGGFVVADLVVTDKDENLAKGLITLWPETFEALEVLAINEDDPDATKIIKKVIESAAVGATAEVIAQSIKFAISGFKKWRGKVKAKDDDILNPPKDDNGRILETEVVREPGGEFKHKVRLEQPLKIIGEPKVGKVGGFWSQWFGARQGLDHRTWRAYDILHGRGTEAEAQIRNQSKFFEHALEKNFGKKLKDFTDDEIDVVNVALGRSLERQIPEDITIILGKNAGKRTKGEKKQLEVFRKEQAIYDKDVATASQAEALSQLPLGVQEEISIMRGMVDDYTGEIIGAGIPGKNMVGRLDSNVGFYISTDYELFSNPKWLEAIKKVLDKDVPATGLKRIGKAIDKRRADDVDALVALDHARMYFRKTYKNSVEGDLSDGAIDDLLRGFINDLKRGDLDFLDIMVPGISKSPVKEHALGKILTERKPLHPDLKLLYREVTDPAQRFRSTIRKQAKLLAEHEFVNNIKIIAESPYGRNIYHVEQPGIDKPLKFGGKLADVANNYLKSVGANPLANVFTTPTFQRTLTRVLEESEPATGLMRYFYPVNAIASGSKTIASHPTHALNIQGNIIFTAANGNIIPLTLPKAAGKEALKRGEFAVDVVRAMLGKNPAMGELFQISKGKLRINSQAYEELQALGLLDSGVNQEYFLRAFESLDNSFRSAPEGLMKWVGRQYKKVGRVYRAEDGVFKAYNYYAEMSKYKPAYPNMPEFELKQFAAERVKNFLPTYTRIPMAVKILRKNFPITAFPSFLTESIRIGKNTITFGVTDSIKGMATGNVQLARIGAERLASTIAVSILGDEFLLDGMLRNAITSDTKKAVDRLSPAWDKHAQRFWTSPFQMNPKNRNHIEAQFINISRSDPYNALRQMAYSTINHIMPLGEKAIAGELTWEKVEEEAKHFLDELMIVAQPILTPSLLAQGVFDLVTRKRKKDPHVGWVAEIADLVYETFEPGSVQAFRAEKESARSRDTLSKLAGKPVSGLSKSGFPDRPENRFWRHMGVGVQTFDFNKSLQHTVAAKSSNINKINKELTTLILNNMGKGAAGYDWEDEGDVTKFYEEVDNVIIKSLQAQRDLAVDLHKAKGFSFQEIVDGEVLTRIVGNEMLDAILRDEGMKDIDKNFDMTIVKGIMKDRIGVFVPPSVSQNIRNNPKFRKAHIPEQIINDLEVYLNKFTSVPLLKEEEE